MIKIISIFIMLIGFSITIFAQCPNAPTASINIANDFYSGVIIKKSADNEATYIISLADYYTDTVSTKQYLTSSHSLTNSINNNYVTTQTHRPWVASLPAVGDYKWIFSWYGYDNSSSDRHAYYQLGNEYLNSLTTENYVSVRPTTDDYEPVVTTLPATGRFVIAWTKFVHHNNAYVRQIVFQIFSKDGIRIGTEHAVNLNYYRQNLSSISGFWYSDDKFVIAWQEATINKFLNSFFRVYDKNGDALTGVIPVDTLPNGYQYINPSVHAFSSGFVISWVKATFNEEKNILYRTFDRSGNPYIYTKEAFNTINKTKEARTYVSGGTWSSSGRPAPYFLISGWQNYSSNEYYHATTRLFKNIANPVPLSDDIQLSYEKHYVMVKDTDEFTGFYDVYVTSELFTQCSNDLRAGFAWTSYPSYSTNDDNYKYPTDAVSYKKFIKFTDNLFDAVQNSSDSEGVIYAPGLDIDDPAEPDLVFPNVYSYEEGE